VPTAKVKLYEQKASDDTEAFAPSKITSDTCGKDSFSLLVLFK
jgi:hypothetical protein